MNSPTLGEFDFSYLEPLNLQSIEVLRGPQSTLWGSSAMGGVIAINTRKGEGPPSGEIFAEYGSFCTHRETVRASAGNDAADFSLAIANTMSDGINIAEGSKKRDLTGLTLGDYITPAAFLDEADGFEVQTGSARLGANFLEDGRIDATLRWIDAEQEMDQNVGNFTVDDPTFKKDQSTRILSTTASKTFLEHWKPTLQLGLALDDVDTHTDFDLTDPTWSISNRIKTQTFNAEFQNDFTLAENDTLTAGAEYRGESGEKLDAQGYHARANTYGVFLQNQLTLFDALHLTAGVRYDEHNQAGDKTTYRFTGAYQVERTQTKFHGSVGTGFHAPTINDLFFPGSGNPDLKPEESFGFDVGAEQHFFSDRFTADVTYFRNEFEEQIAWRQITPSVWRPVNISKTTAQGVELTLSARVIDPLTFRASYTYQDTLDKENDVPLDRIPEHTVSVGATYTPIERLTIDASVLIMQDRYQLNGLQLQAMDDFVRVDITASYRIVDALRAHLRIENLTDYDYEEIAGYQSPGIGVYGGLSWQF